MTGEVWDMGCFLVIKDRVVQGGEFTGAPCWLPPGPETKQDPMGLRDAKPLCVPHFLITGNRLHSASLMSLPSITHVQTVAHRGREEMQRYGRSHQERIGQGWGAGPGSPSRGTRTVSLFSRQTEAPTRWEK